MRVYAFLNILFLSVLLVAFWSAMPVQADPSWSIQTVTDNAVGAGSNGYCPITVDSNNYPHIAYDEGYASWNGSVWSTQNISSVLDNTYGLVMDTNDNPHILYHAGQTIYGQGGLMIASWTGSNWANQIVDQNGGFGAIALDSSGNPHVAYISGEEIKYASKTGSNWIIQTVKNASEYHGDLSLALDSNNTPYIMYGLSSTYHDNGSGLDYQTINVKLAIFKNSTWNTQTVPLPPPIGESSNIVLDSKGYPHFICSQNHYRSSEDRNLIYTLLYVSWDGTDWITQTVASNITAEDYAISGVGFLMLDSHDFPHFVSFIASSSRFMYASWTGSSWNIQTVNLNVAATGPCYLVIGSDGTPHISFRVGGINDRTANIMYATANESTIITPSPMQSLWSSSGLTLVLTAIIIIIAVTITVYIWKKRKKLSQH